MAQIPLERGLEVLRGRTRIVTGVIIAYLVLSVMMIFMVLGLIGGQINFDAADELDAISSIAGLASVAYYAVFFLSVITIGMWIYRAHANLRAAGIESLEFSPGWAVGWFFVPIANLFKPFQAMRQLWTVSHQNTDSFGREAPPELIPWWGGYVIGSILRNLSNRLATDQESIAYLLDGMGCIAMMVSAWCLLRIVRRIMNAQEHILTRADIFA